MVKLIYLSIVVVLLTLGLWFFLLYKGSSIQNYKVIDNALNLKITGETGLLKDVDLVNDNANKKLIVNKLCENDYNHLIRGEDLINTGNGWQTKIIYSLDGDNNPIFKEENNEPKLYNVTVLTNEGTNKPLSVDIPDLGKFSVIRPDDIIMKDGSLKVKVNPIPSKFIPFSSSDNTFDIALRKDITVTSITYLSYSNFLLFIILNITLFKFIFAKMENLMIATYSYVMIKIVIVFLFYLTSVIFQILYETSLLEFGQYAINYMWVDFGLLTVATIVNSIDVFF